MFVPLGFSINNQLRLSLWPASREDSTGEPRNAGQCADLEWYNLWGKKWKINYTSKHLGHKSQDIQRARLTYVVLIA